MLWSLVDPEFAEGGRATIGYVVPSIVIEGWL